MLYEVITGFIGFHLANKLLEQGAEVVGIDNINNYYSTELKYARVITSYSIHYTKLYEYARPTTKSRSMRRRPGIAIESKPASLVSVSRARSWVRSRESPSPTACCAISHTSRRKRWKRSIPARSVTGPSYNFV